MRCMVLGCLLAAWTVCAWTQSKTLAQVSNPSPASPQQSPSTAAARELEQKQRQLAQQYGKLEELFMRMSELEAVSNPTRAGLLMQASQLSKQLVTQQRLNQASDLLAKGQYTRAIQEQEAALENLKKLLELLQSENRSKRLRDDRKRIEEVLKDIRRIENIQRATRGRTEAGQDAEQAAKDQGDLEQQLGTVEDDLQAAQEGDKPDGDKTDDGKPNDKKSDTQQPKNSTDKSQEKPSNDQSGKQPDDQSQPNEKGNESESAKEPKDQNKPADQKSKPNGDEKSPDASSESGEPKEDSSAESSKKSDKSDDSSEGESGETGDEDKESQSPDAKKPESREKQARKRVQQARKKMQDAEKKLKTDKRKQAVEDQRKAERELEQAITELERILTQLREEEIERSLVDLETRIRKMLDLQRPVREQSEKLSTLAGEAKDRQLEIQSNKLSIEQLKVVMEGQRALLLLQDEGSSMAFPEMLEQVNKDAQLVAKRLTAADVSPSTIAIEDEIIGALEEMLDSLKQVQKKREDKKQQQQQQQQEGGEPQDQPLVDKIAELKLIKTLQLRVNKRTERLASETNATDDLLGQIGDPGKLVELQDLAGRQQKIQEVTRDILLQNKKD